MCTVLSIGTIGGVLACLLRHFRASLASLPLLGQPLGRLPVRQPDHESEKWLMWIRVVSIYSHSPCVSTASDFEALAIMLQHGMLSDAAWQHLQSWQCGDC